MMRRVRDAAVAPISGGSELLLVLIGFGALTVALTYPLAFHAGSLGRIDNGDGQFSIWNVAWVARTLVVDPRHVFDANIFYPRRWTLLYSESNLGAGAIAIPAYSATHNPYAAHNVALLLSFVLAATGTYYLVRYLTGDRAAAAIAGVTFAFCPFVLGHTAHIQLMMTAGLPFSLLAFHRLADRPAAARGAALGATMAVQALFCGYYAVFVALMIGFTVLVVAAMRHLWTDAPYWRAIALAAAIAVAAVAPLLALYLDLHRAGGFGRSLAGARQYSADWRSYLASSSYAHGWMLSMLGRWGETAFPGFVASVSGVAGAVAAWRGSGRLRETLLIYGGLAALSFWASLGPDAGLYTVLHAAIPVFVLMRAPSRFALIVTFGLSVLAGYGLSALWSRVSRPRLAAVIVFFAAAAELLAPGAWRKVGRTPAAYVTLAALPSGPVLELPVYSEKFAFLRAQYMLGSTIHWMPLVEGYSDFIPKEFNDEAETLGEFPTRDAFRLIGRDRVRYAVFHLDRYQGDMAASLTARLREFAPYLRQIYADTQIALYEIVGYPPREVEPAASPSGDR